MNRPGNGHLARDGVAALRATEESLFFIVGAGRSGTTLLQVMLASHPEIALPNETGFYSLIRRKNLRRLGELTTSETFRAGFDTAMAFWRIRELELDHERVWELCQHRPPSWETLFLAILTAFGEDRGAPRVGEKSPRHVEYLGLLSERFPGAAFIHVIRDPRAVACSHHRTYGIRSIGAKCDVWGRAIDQHERFAEPLGERYLTIRYEDLVRDPALQLRRACAHLRCEYSPAMLEYPERHDPGFARNQIHHMKNTLKPVFTSRLDAWKEELSTDQVALVEHALASRMGSLGYRPVGARTRLPGLKLRLHRIMDRAGRVVDRVRTAMGLEVRRRRKR